MKPRKFDFRINLSIDSEFEKALNAARFSKRMTKTGYIRDALVKDLIAGGFLNVNIAGNAR